MENKNRIEILKEIGLRCTNEFFVNGGNERMCLSLIGNLIGDTIAIVETISNLNELVEDNVNAGNTIFSCLRAIKVTENEYGKINWLGDYMSQYLLKLPNYLKENHNSDYRDFIKYFRGSQS